MIDIGSKGVISKNIQTSSGMLYEKTKIKVVDKTLYKVQVSDMAGRLFWVKHSDILM